MLSIDQQNVLGITSVVLFYANLVKEIQWLRKVQKKPSKMWHNKLKMKIKQKMEICVWKWKRIGEGVPFLKFNN